MKWFRNIKLLQIVMLTTLSIGVFSNTFTNEFAWDDILLIQENFYIRNCKNIPHFFTPRYSNELHPSPGVYRPLRTATFALDYFFWKLNPVGYHLVNVLLHTLNVLLVYYLTIFIRRQRFERTDAKFNGCRIFFDWPFLAAAFFATHPIHTESINLVKNRSDLMALMFFLLSFLLFVKHLTTVDGKPRRLPIIGAWICFVPAILSKEMALTLPGVLALYMICFYPTAGLKKKMFGLVPYGVLIIIYFWFTKTYIKKDVLVPAAPSPSLEPLQHVLTVIKTVGIYLKMLLVPFPLSIDHGFILPGSVFEPAILMSVTLAALVLAVMVIAYRYSPLVCFAAGWILLTLIPVANVIFLTTRPIAEQRLYIPSLGFCLLLGYGIERLSYVRGQQRKVGWTVILGGILSTLVLGLYAAITVDRNADWQDRLTLYAKTLSINPKNARINNNFGYELSKTGDYDTAISYYLEALRLQPDHVKTLNNLGEALIETGRIDEGLHYHETAFRLEQGSVKAWFSMGFAFYKAKKYGAAVNYYETALRLKPDYVNARYNLGLVLYKLGRFEEAISQYREVLRLVPEYVDAHINLGVVLSDLNRPTDAVDHFLTAIELDPDSAEAHVNLGVIYSEAGRLDKALSHFATALRLDPASVETHRNLGAAFFNAGHYDEALNYFSEAVRLKPDDSAALTGLGLTLLATGRGEEATAPFKAWLKLEPDNADTYCYLGVAAMTRQNLPEAEKYFRRSLQINPDHLKARKGLESCQTGLAKRRSDGDTP